MLRRRINLNKKNINSMLPFENNLNINHQPDYIKSNFLDSRIPSTSFKQSNTNVDCKKTNEEHKHDDLAIELLRLTSTMKQNFTTAGTIIKEDNQV